jgi:HEPN domain-containing protein
MTTEEKVEYWVQISDEDLIIAETMLKNHHYMYTGFMCHQVIEKILKAVYEKLKQEVSPYTHNIIHLAELTCLYEMLSDEQKSFLNALSPLNIEARYPEYKSQIKKIMTYEHGKYIYEQTILMQRWIKEKILSEK